MLHIYDQHDFIYSFSLDALDRTQEDWTNYTTVELLPQNEYTLQKFDTETNTWKYIRRHYGDSDPLDELLTYEDARKRDYPKMEDYLDGIVKGDTEQIEAYKVKCNEVKTMWAKDMEPITLHEYFRRRGVNISN